MDYSAKVRIFSEKKGLNSGIFLYLCAIKLKI